MVARVILLRRPGLETSPSGGSSEESGQNLNSQSLDSRSLEKEQITCISRVALAYGHWAV